MQVGITARFHCACEHGENNNDENIELLQRPVLAKDESRGVTPVFLVGGNTVAPLTRELR